VVEGRLAAAQAGVVDDVVVDQRGRPLAAALGDVLAGVVDERDVRIQMMAKDGLGRDQLVGDEIDEAPGQEGPGRLGLFRRRVEEGRILHGIRLLVPRRTERARE
jgi:hypothetical protein